MDQTIKITMAELKEVVKASCDEEDVEQFFYLFKSTEKKETFWPHINFPSIFLIAAVSFLALSVKIIIESYWGVN